MKRTVFVMGLILLAPAACKKKNDGASDNAAAEVVEATPECKAAGEHVQELMLAMTKADAPDNEKSAAFGKSRVAADKVAAACTKDKWPAEAIKCVSTADKLADCKLTPEQAKALPAI
jgi:hypothetical protein